MCVGPDYKRPFRCQYCKKGLVYPLGAGEGLVEYAMTASSSSSLSPSSSSSSPLFKKPCIQATSLASSLLTHCPHCSLLPSPEHTTLYLHQEQELCEQLQNLTELSEELIHLVDFDDNEDDFTRAVPAEQEVTYSSSSGHTSVLHSSHHLYFWLLDVIITALSDCAKAATATADTTASAAAIEGEGEQYEECTHHLQQSASLTHTHTPSTTSSSSSSSSSSSDTTQQDAINQQLKYFLLKLIKLLESQPPEVHTDKASYYVQLAQVELALGCISEARQADRQAYHYSCLACGKNTPTTIALKELIDDED